MKFIVYFCVATIAALSVALGLDWVSAPMSPMPASPYELRAAVPPPPPAVVARVEPRAEPQAETKPQAPVPAVAAVQPAAVPPAPVPAEPPPAIIADEPEVAAPPAPRCDLDACASAYRSFTPEDCTYQPNEGPRRLCTRGTPPAIAAPAIVPSTAPEARAQACNIAACSQSYPRSFSAEDCTFLPANGLRRVCTK